MVQFDDIPNMSPEENHDLEEKGTPPTEIPEHVMAIDSVHSRQTYHLTLMTTSKPYGLVQTLKTPSHRSPARGSLSDLTGRL